MTEDGDAVPAKFARFTDPSAIGTIDVYQVPTLKRRTCEGCYEFKKAREEFTLKYRGVSQMPRAMQRAFNLKA
jgi:hypothetical protein